MVWNVFRYDINSKKIEIFNVFNHGRFLEDVKNNLIKCETKEKFAEELIKDLRYYYWCKAEHEIVLTSWVPHIKIDELNRLNIEREKSLKDYGKEPYSLHVNPDVTKKIDIYDQIILNWQSFLDMVWSHKENKNELIK